MNGAHLHLILNHFPLIGLICCVALLLGGLWRKTPDVARAGIVALVIVAVISIPVYLTGEPAEEIVEQLPGVSDDLIHPHEEAALVALIALEVLGALALVGLIVFRGPNPLPGWFVPTLLVLGFLATGWLAWVSYLGGQIVHQEARPDFDSAAAEVSLTG